MDYSKILSSTVQDIKPSGIRKFFDLLENMQGVVAGPRFALLLHPPGEGDILSQRGWGGSPYLQQHLPQTLVLFWRPLSQPENSQVMLDVLG